VQLILLHYTKVQERMGYSWTCSKRDGGSLLSNIFKAMCMTFVFYWWGNSQIHYWGPCNTTETWCDKLGLSVNPIKTGFVVFTRRRKLPGFSEPHFFGVILHCSMSVNYLRVVLDSRLTWRFYVKVRKAHNLLCAYRRVNGVKWGLRHKVVHWLYVCIIRPSIPFASLIWWPGC